MDDEMTRQELIAFNGSWRIVFDDLEVLSPNV